MERRAPAYPAGNPAQAAAGQAQGTADLAEAAQHADGTAWASQAGASQAGASQAGPVQRGTAAVSSSAAV